VLGTGVGVAAASTALGWRLDAVTGAGGRTAHAPEAALLSAVGGVLAMLAIFAALGAAAALVRSNPKRAAGKARARAAWRAPPPRRVRLCYTACDETLIG